MLVKGVRLIRQLPGGAFNANRSDIDVEGRAKQIHDTIVKLGLPIEGFYVHDPSLTRLNNHEVLGVNLGTNKVDPRVISNARLDLERQGFKVSIDIDGSSCLGLFFDLSSNLYIYGTK